MYDWAALRLLNSSSKCEAKRALSRLNASHPRGSRLNHEVTAGEVFALLWNAMADILGTGATATLLLSIITRKSPPFIS